MLHGGISELPCHKLKLSCYCFQREVQPQRKMQAFGLQKEMMKGSRKTVQPPGLLVPCQMALFRQCTWVYLCGDGNASLWKRSAQVLSIAEACNARELHILIFHLTPNIATQNLFFCCTYWLDSVTLSVFSNLNDSMILIPFSFTKPPKAEMHIQQQQLVSLISGKALKMWRMIRGRNSLCA